MDVRWLRFHGAIAVPMTARCPGARALHNVTLLGAFLATRTYQPRFVPIGNVAQPRIIGKDGKSTWRSSLATYSS